MSQIPSGLKFTRSHEWIELDGDTATIGISDHAQALLGDLVYVELPEVDATLSQGDACSVVESVKAASDVYSPLSGTVTAVNEELEDSPENINTDAYGAWIFKIQISDSEELQELMDADSYADEIAED